MERASVERASGVLLHLSSLPNTYGIGSFGRTAYDFVDFLVETGQKYWQILPLTTTGFGDSPYQSFSAFAGNPHFIDFDLLIEQGLLEKSDLAGIDFGSDATKVDYQKVTHERRPILAKAVSTFIALKRHENSDFQAFLSDNNKWLNPFSTFMSVKEAFDSKPWYEWPEPFKIYDEAVLMKYCDVHKEQTDYYTVTQYWFFEQWSKLKQYANQHQIEIIGDLPIYVARDSVEMWQTPELFKVDEQLNPTGVAGIPPDKFSKDGQYWGNPLYDWKYMKMQDYAWWIWRIEESFKLYDLVRIDHFRGFEGYWEVPFGARTSAAGSWKKGPGTDLFKQIKKELGELKIIAEDLGFITEEVIEMREAAGFPGMKILQNGFNGLEDSEHLPHHYTFHTVAYVGTHDNPTAIDWYDNYANSKQREQVDLYLNRKPEEPVSDALNRGIASSPSQIAIYTIQDLLRLGEEGRMNIPATIGDNWDWRIKPDTVTEYVKERLLLLTQTYFRMNEAKEM